MTLVTVKIVGQNIYSVGDTKITYSNGIGSNPILNGSIKQYIFNNLLVCFAGCVYSFEQDIQKYRNCRSLEDVLKIAISNAVDYELLAASCNPCRIIIVKDRIVSDVNAGYIGDAMAFETYQKHYHEPKQQLNPPNTGEISIFRLPEPIGEGDDYQRMYRAMKEVVSDASVESVNGAVITAAIHKGSFQYMMYCDIFTDEVVVPESGESKTIGFGTKEGGGCAVEFSTCNENHGLSLKPAYYFLQGGFGVVFPEKEDSVSNALLVHAENPCQWALATRDLLGEAVISGYLSIDHCGIEGEKYIAVGDFSRALDCYELKIDSARKFNDPIAKLDRYFFGYYVCLFNSGNQSLAIQEINTLVENNAGLENCKRYRDAMAAALTKPCS
jgi:tetratricopeptide (TPR) repeat protein